MLADRLAHLSGLDHDALVAELATLIAEGTAAQADGPEAAELEHLSAYLLVLLEHAPLDSTALLLEALAARAARGEERPAGLLTALGVLAGGALRRQIRERSARVPGAVEPTETQSIGTLHVETAIAVEDDGFELIVAALGRPGSEQRQVAAFCIEHAVTGGALVECRLGAPDSAEAARAALVPRDGAPAPATLTADEVIRRVRAATRTAAEAGIALDFDAGVAFACLVPMLERGGEELPRPAVRTLDFEEGAADAPRETDATPSVHGDEAGARSAIKALLDELEHYARAHHAPDSAMWAHGDFVASTMLEWKVDYDDGQLEHWTRSDLVAFLLDYFPRKVTMASESLEAVPECALGFLTFLSTRGALAGGSLGDLGDTLSTLRGDFLRRARDSRNYGLAKSMAMQMLAEGVDMADPDAVDAWMVDFNARPRASRDAIVSAAPDRMLALARSGEPLLASGRASSGRRSARRKAQKAARRRNRRG